ncbi:MAG TPA: pitrilysin family protein [Pyrinomonadaceae bacterium]|nr:pitrilysin family protein [Pyrinomonadaceae bacterium]
MKEDIQETKLENGLVVLTDRMPGVRSATLGFFYRIGSRNEPDELNGITHFIEHCVFKGTTRRTALEIAIEQDRLGGNLEAFTTHEETGFVIKVIDDRLEAAFDLLSDMLTDPRLNDEDLVNEQRVIIEEMKMNEDSPEDLLSDIFQREFFPGHPLGLNITGTPETVRSFSSELTRRYHDQNFRSGNLVIAAAGNVEHELLLDLVRSSNFSRPHVATDQRKQELPTPTTAAPISANHREDLEQVHFVFATPTVSGHDPRRYAADLLANILGGGSASRLWQKVREERGLTYSIGAGAVMFRDCGFLSISGSASPEHLNEITDLVTAELRSLVGNKVSDEELQLQKDQARAAILLALEDSASRAASLAQSELTHGRQIRVEETLSGIDAVTLNDIQDIAAEYFRAEKIAFAALGDLGGFTMGRERLDLGN